MLRCELARQLEFAISDTFTDRPTLVPTFLRALRAQIDAITAGHCDEHAVAFCEEASPPRAGIWRELHSCKPDDVDSDAWMGLFEYAVGKMMHLLGGAQQVLAFARDALDPARFMWLERDKRLLTR